MRWESITWPYVAGFFDGEGSLTCPNPGKISYRIQIVQSDLAVLRVISCFLESEGLTVRFGKEQRKLYDNGRVRQTKPCWMMWLGGRKDVTAFISKTLPHLILKKTLAQDVWRTLRLFPDMRGYRDRDTKGRILPHFAKCPDVKRFR